MLATVALATGLIFSPVFATPLQTPLPIVTPQATWSNVVEMPNFKVDIDPTSIKMVVRHNGFEMLSTMRMSFGTPIAVPGQTKVGAYYINEIAAKCKDDAIAFEKSTVYAADGEALATGTDVALVKNPRNSKSFITVWLHMACAQFKGKKPPIII